MHVGRLRQVVERFGERGQSRAAKTLGVSKGSLSRMLRDPKVAKAVRRHTVERMERAVELPAGRLWDGDSESFSEVSRKTSENSGGVRERAPSYGGIGPGDERGGLWVIEQMSLALADIARRLREATSR